MDALQCINVGISSRFIVEESIIKGDGVVNTKVQKCLAIYNVTWTYYGFNHLPSFFRRL